MKKNFLALTTALLQLSSISLSAKCMEPKLEKRPEDSCVVATCLNLDSLPSIMESEEITLTKLTNEDVEPLAQLVLNGGIGEYFDIFYPIKYDDRDSIINDLILCNTNPDMGSLNYVVKAPGNGKCVGEIFALFDDEKPGSVEISFWVAAEARGNNYAYKASILFIDKILEMLPTINEIKFSAVRDNIASVKTIEKIKNHFNDRLESFELILTEMNSKILKPNKGPVGLKIIQGQKKITIEQLYKKEKSMVVVCQEQEKMHTTCTKGQKPVFAKPSDLKRSEEDMFVEKISTFSNDFLEKGENVWTVMKYTFVFPK